MTDEQRKRVHDITYSCEDRQDLAERIVGLEDECAKLRELVGVYGHMLTHDGTPFESLEWSHKAEVLESELGIEV